jgi:hypothetical protein
MDTDSLHHWTSRRLAWWSALRTKGRAHFALWYGVGFGGGHMFVVTTLGLLITWLFTGKLIPHWQVYLLLNALALPIAGYFLGRRI